MFVKFLGHSGQVIQEELNRAQQDVVVRQKNKLQLLLIKLVLDFIISCVQSKVTLHLWVWNKVQPHVKLLDRPLGFGGKHSSNRSSNVHSPQTTGDRK